MKSNLHISPIHPFPARMAPSLAWRELDKGTKPLRVLDPMAGSGTTLVIARQLGHFATGIDSDPLARLIAGVWCADIDEELIERKASDVLNRAAAIYSKTTAWHAYPKHADEETKRFIRFWFDPDNRRQLFSLATSISRLRREDVRQVLWCAFSRLIITKTSGASKAMDVSHSRPHRVYDKGPLKPLEAFLPSVRRLIKRSPFRSGSTEMPKACIHAGDARSMPIEDSSIDIVITSPPYSNAIDYLRGHKLSLVWMGEIISDIRDLRGNSIGSEVKYRSEELEANRVTQAFQALGEVNTLTQRAAGVLKRYVHDMDRVLAETRRVLVTGGRAKFVIGDARLENVYISNSRAIQSLARHHKFDIIGRTHRKLPDNRRYMPPPSAKSAGHAMQGRMRKEIILTLNAA